MAPGACGGEATLTLSMSLRASSERARRCAICCETCAKRARGREFCSSAHILFLLPAFQIRTRVRRPARANMVTRGGEEVGSPARWRKSRAERSSLHRVVCHVRGLIGSVRPRHDSPGLATRRTLAREGLLLLLCDKTACYPDYIACAWHTPRHADTSLQRLLNQLQHLVSLAP